MLPGNFCLNATNNHSGYVDCYHFVHPSFLLLKSQPSTFKPGETSGACVKDIATKIVEIERRVTASNCFYKLHRLDDVPRPQVRHVDLEVARGRPGIMLQVRR